MKKNLLLLTLVSGFLYITLSSHKVGPAAIASLECTGVTGPSGCGGATCHGPSPSYDISDTVLVFDAAGMPASFYYPGANYTFRVRGVNGSTSILPKFGYQLTAVKYGTPISVGMLLPGTGFHTATLGSVSVSEHFINSLWGTGTGGLGTVYQVDVHWIAPPAGTGTVALRAVVNAVDTNGTAGAEDHWPPPGPPIILPEAPPPPIVGPAYVCAGSSTTLSVITPGGTWMSSDPTIASISSTGVLTGVAPGITYIMYSTASGSTGMSVTVNPVPAPIAGIPGVCPGGHSVLTDATPGGTWISSNPSIAGIGSTDGVLYAVGTIAGTSTITYKMPATSCYSTMTVSLPVSTTLMGGFVFCPGETSTFTHLFAGGIWYTSNPSVATVSSSGVVFGVAPGTSIISYSLGTTFCDASQNVLVLTNPVATISGGSTVCLDRTITLTGDPGGGNWFSSDPSKASVDLVSGVVTGVAAGTANIVYSLPWACGHPGANRWVTVSNAGPCSVGITNPFAQANEVQIFPNPGNGSFSLNVLSMIDEEAHVIVTNIVGAKVSEFTIKTNEVNSITLNQPAGTYFLSATTLSNKHFIKIVVQ